MKESYKTKILGYYRRHKRMPSYQELCVLLGFSSKNAAFKLVQKLIADGVVRKDERGKLVPVALVGEVPLLGLVEAGIPTSTEEVNLDTINLEELLVGDPSQTYLLRVKGDSMMEAGIYDGDLVVAERRGNGKNGDIVIAEVDGLWTMKYLRHTKDGAPYLEPANSRYDDIYPEESLRIGAVVKGVIRKFY